MKCCRRHREINEHVYDYHLRYIFQFLFLAGYTSAPVVGAFDCVVGP